ncbi:hypothetical protein, partial [Dysosmobacter sp.]|uniref:hypothetical protein n=1 Tax=Dysosmobacter sp. TaxID=2591382 RepID=UPI003AB1331F
KNCFFLAGRSWESPFYGAFQQHIHMKSLVSYPQTFGIATVKFGHLSEFCVFPVFDWTEPEKTFKIYANRL